MVVLDVPSIPLSSPADLDVHQQRVAAHDQGPLLVLAGPGTGKTTTIVEAVAAKLAGTNGDPVPAAQLLVLTFGRKAADEIRDRIARRLQGGALPLVSTFHSYSYSLVREFSDPAAFQAPPRLLSGPEQEHRVRELLTNSIKDGRVSWPADLEPAIGTRGLAALVRELIAKAQALDITAPELAALGDQAGVPVWSSIAGFLDEYLDVLDAEGVMDYAELVHRAVALAGVPDIGQQLRNRYQAVFVDEYQDTDAAQVRLLQNITTPMTSLVAVGDPDQAIYGFRGADVGGILRFRDDFPTVDGDPTPIEVLSKTRRFGEVIRDAAGRVIRRVSLGTLPAQIQKAHRLPSCTAPTRGDVRVLTFDSIAAQAASVADDVRRTRLRGDVQSWSDIAILVRSSARDLAPLQQALLTAGVPVAVPGDDIPLRAQPGIAPLLDVLRVAATPEVLTADRARRLLMSPLVGMDPSGLRRLGRALRGLDASETLPSTRSSADLIRDAIADPALLIEVDARSAEPVRHLARIINAAQEAIAANQAVEQVLWTVWSATSWPQRLRQAALGEGAGGRVADRDLDATVALFGLASRADAAFDGRRGVGNFLAELDRQSLATPMAAGAVQTRDAVALMTAHRAKGLQWRRVYVVGVQEGQWPDLRIRGSLLQTDRLDVTGLVAPKTVADMLDEERRLFFVACTRAQEVLTVTAVRSFDDSGAQPSRFLEAVAASPDVDNRHEGGYLADPLSMPALVAELRSQVEDPQASEARKTVAADRLAMLAGQGVVAADPTNWWGIPEWTDNDHPVRDPAEPLRFSGSAWTGIDSCSLSWFLDREVKGAVTRGSAPAFGSVVHALADAVARGELAADTDVLVGRAEQVWAGLGFEADWQAQEELVAIRQALDLFLRWHEAQPDRKVVATELKFAANLEIADDAVAVNGSIDRLERDSDGMLHIVDLKTGRKPPTGPEVAEHLQLSLYQLAGEEHAFDDRTDNNGVAGAELVQLRSPVARTGLPKVQVQPPIDVEAVKERLAEAVEIVRSERFTPDPVSGMCRNCQFLLVCPAQSLGEQVTT